MQYLWQSIRAGTVAAALVLTLAGCGGGGGSGPGPAPAAARGTVVDLETGQPISGASVRSAGRSTRTATDGTFRLGIETGISTITISRKSYHTATFTVEAEFGQEVEVGTLTLSNQQSAPPPPAFE